MRLAQPLLDLSSGAAVKEAWNTLCVVETRRAQNKLGKSQAFRPAGDPWIGGLATLASASPNTDHCWNPQSTNLEARPTPSWFQAIRTGRAAGDRSQGVVCADPCMPAALLKRWEPPVSEESRLSGKTANGDNLPQQAPQGVPRRFSVQGAQHVQAAGPGVRLRSSVHGRRLSEP